MSTGAVELLNKLLDRLERQQVPGRRITIRPPLEFASPSAKAALDEGLRAAEAAGAVRIEMDRDAPHLIARVLLEDGPSLYRHLGRKPAADQLRAALKVLAGCDVVTDEACRVRDHLAERWSAGGSAAGFGKDDAPGAVAFLRVVDAAMLPMGDLQLPLRSRSVRLLGDSKMIEKALPKILSVLRDIGRIAPELSRDDALQLLGLEKFPQPVLIAGPVMVKDRSLPDLPCIALPAEAIEELVAPEAASLLTIENLESFNRHVREARRARDVVIYTAGFPSPTLLAAVRRIIASAGLSHSFHWGDLDWGGIAIARQIEIASGVPLRLHLMNPDLARSHGHRLGSRDRPVQVPDESSLAPLSRYLAEDDARMLEQELLDPQPVAGNPDA